MRTASLDVAEGVRSIRARYVAGDRLYGGERRERLKAPINTLLIANLAPAALVSPVQGDLVAYNSWRGRRPVIRTRNVETDRDSILDEGAYGVAWATDGALAYFKSALRELDPDNVRGYVGHVVVRPSLEAPPDRWTTKPGVYVPAAWAGDRLLVYRIGKAWPDLLALDRPGRVRVLARAGALVALSPDGSRAFVSTYGANPPIVRVLDVASGDEVARFDFARDGAAKELADVRFVSEAGSWVGDTVVAPASESLLVFRVGAGSIGLEQLLRIDGSRFPLGLFEPQADESGRILAWGQLPEKPRQPFPDAAVVECDREKLECVLGPPVASVEGPRLVYNPSRP